MDIQRIKDFLLNDLWANMGNADSVAFIIFTLLAFLLGFLLSAIAAGRRRRKLQKELKAVRHELSNIKAELGALQEQHELKTAELQKAELTIGDLNKKIEVMEAEKKQLHMDLYNANEIIEKHNANIAAYESTIEDLNNQILGLKAKQNTSGKFNYAGQDASGAIDRLTLLEEKINKLDSENEMLRADLNKLKSGTKLAIADIAPTVSSEPVAASNPADEVLELSAQPAKNMVSFIGTSIPDAGGVVNDLTVIEGIGPFLEKKLNGIGIYNYEQIAALNEETIPVVTEQIEFFHGRIEKDDWVGQAKRLLGLETKRVIRARTIATEEDDVKEAKTEITAKSEEVSEETTQIEGTSTEEVGEMLINPFEEFGQDDLKIVEGIGPKIEGLLKEAGIDTWQKLAESTAEDLRKILDNAGSRYRIHNPSTWPQQSEFAANGNWAKLKAYQDYLIGGRDVAEES